MKTLTEQFEDYKAILFFMNPDENLKGWTNEANFINHYTDQWNDLMEIVDKIESLGYWLNRINGDVWIVDNEDNIVVNNPMHEDSNAVYLICLEFIKWHNNQKN
jgi:hypothetical protein